jgi:hypothetical protein
LYPSAIPTPGPTKLLRNEPDVPIYFVFRYHTEFVAGRLIDSLIPSVVGFSVID